MKEVGEVLADGLNVHSGGPTGRVVDSLSKGARFDVLEHRIGAKWPWLRIAYGSGKSRVVGWVCEQRDSKLFVETFFLSDAKPCPAPRKQPDIPNHDAVGFAVSIAMVVILAVLLFAWWFLSYELI